MLDKVAGYFNAPPTEHEKSDPDKDRLIHAFVGLLVYGIL